ncbi:hypothetical protein L1049_005133 [Liquidambar formosana]|uniref:NAB domain-containing protein n=1 Tax=Liquidambar formosana TaxID=63359 RepID=A0AAP0WWD5_LIQFO
MANLSQVESRRKYSWWWDSHISPKNSKWLQENLTDMDAMVKQMIKVIEEDADSFARRAEMYYKKRPELMKLVEEFYRAYRALAERYDHATGALRQAHRTMAEAFPNQVPMVLTDDSPAGSSASEAEPHTPEMSLPIRALFDPEELQKDASSSHLHAVKRNGAFIEESDSGTSKKGLKQLNDLFGSREAALNHAKFSEGRVRKGLNFNEGEDKERSVEKNDNHKSEMDVLIMKETLAKLQAEKEAGLVQYQQSLERLSNLESEVIRAQEDSRGLNERARKAEAEVSTLKEALTKFEAEREASLLQYQQCMDRISTLEKNISCAQNDAKELDERASKAEIEAQTLKQDIAIVEAAKEAALIQHKESLEMISNLKNKLLHAEGDARRINERADEAECEIKSLKQALTKLTEEKEAAALQYQQCLETISSLEHKISCDQEEAQRLNGEIDSGVVKLKDAQEQCLLLEKSNQSLQSELESLAQKMGTQSQELTEKQKELGRLWTCLQEERFRFIEAESAFQTLQHLHSQSQEDLRSLAAELQNRAQILKEMEDHNQGLHDEVRKVKEENKSLNELNLSSAVSLKNMQGEIVSLRETKGKLEEEVELRVDQRNALQQEIYCLKEELNELNKKHQGVLEQVDLVGLNRECFGSSVKEMQDENSTLKEICQREKNEKVALLEKLEIMNKLLEKNALLENSLSDLNAELEGVKEKVKVLEESCQLLLGEKSTLLAEKVTLISQLQIMAENLGKLSEKNAILENSLCDANAELEGLRIKSKSLEDSYQLLDNDKSTLITERDSLVSRLKITQQRLEGLEKRYTELEEKHSGLEKDKESTLRKVEELQVSLNFEKQEHANFTQLRETRMAGLESQICRLQEEGQQRKKEFEEELDKALNAQFEIFILQKCVQDLEEKNFSLLIEFQKLLAASKLSEKLISELEHENLEQQVETKSLFDQINKMRMGMYQVSKVLDIIPDHECEDKVVQDETHINHIVGKLDDTKNSLFKTLEDNQQLILEKSVLFTLLGQLRLETASLETEKNTFEQELRIRCQQFFLLQSESHKLMGRNEELRQRVNEVVHKEEELMIEIENLHVNLLELQGAYQNLQKENSEVLEEKRSLSKEFLKLKEENHALQEENSVLFGETLSLSNLSLVFKNFFTEKSVELEELGENLRKLNGVNCALEEKVIIMEGKLETVDAENLHLKESIEKSENELKTVRFVSDQLNNEIANGRDLLHRKEVELLEAEQKFNAVANEKTELQIIMEDLKREYDEVKAIKENQEKQILKLSEANDNQNKESGCLREANQRLEAELLKLREEHEETKIREESLSSELQKVRNRAEMWETEAAAFFGEMQISAIHEALFKEKVHELIEACQSLEDGSNSQGMEIELLKERVSTLEDENGRLKAQSAAYILAIDSLRDCISSLEDQTLLHTELHKSDNEEAKDSELVSHLHTESCCEQSEDLNAKAPDGFSDMQDLQSRIKAIEKAVMEMERVATQENLNVTTKLEAAMRQIKELKSESSSRRENVEISRLVTLPQEEGEQKDGLSDDYKLRKPIPENSEARNELLTKDIVLDQISECSSYGRSRRGTVEADDQMLELWETTDQDSSIDLKVGKAKGANVPAAYYQTGAVEKHKSEYPSSEILVEKELGVDKLEISKRFTEPRQEGSKRKVLERLASDVQKLTNLQITVQDLKRKVDIIEKSKKGKGIEYDTVKEQLEEAEEAILKLFDINGKLMKNAEDNSLSYEGKTAIELEESGSVRRRRVSEQARRGSEKIGRLQLEVQKIQFLLLKLDDEKESKGRTRITERKSRVLLRDYLYGGVRTTYKRKKATFCACVQPPTKGD